MRQLFFAMVASSLVSTYAVASDEIGVEVSVVVTNEVGNPIPTAVVRHPEDPRRQPVNAETGVWKERVLYLEDGSELIFEKGGTLELEVSAPGYVNKRIKYLIRKRKNRVPVVLQKMSLDDDDDDFEDEPVIQFGRDKPID